MARLALEALPPYVFYHIAALLLPRDMGALLRTCRATWRHGQHPHFWDARAQRRLSAAAARTMAGLPWMAPRQWLPAKPWLAYAMTSGWLGRGFTFTMSAEDAAGLAPGMHDTMTFSVYENGKFLHDAGVPHRVKVHETSDWALCIRVADPGYAEALLPDGTMKIHFCRVQTNWRDSDNICRRLFWPTFAREDDDRIAYMFNK